MSLRLMPLVLLGLLTSFACAGEGEVPAVEVTPPPAPEPPPKTPYQQVMEFRDLEGAIAFTKPDMKDMTGDLCTGQILLAAWGAHNMRWGMVHPEKNETSFDLVRKDSDAARGKRLCLTGTIIEIAKLDMGVVTTFHGLIMSRQRDIYTFLAVGDTGELVGGSHAGFCGVVIGNYDYANSVGGTGHAVSLVGMFDLPSNR